MLFCSFRLIPVGKTQTDTDTGLKSDFNIHMQDQGVIKSMTQQPPEDETTSKCAEYRQTVLHGLIGLV